jgi:hypothetical protein
MVSRDEEMKDVKEPDDQLLEEWNVIAAQVQMLALKAEAAQRSSEPAELETR